MLQKIEGRLYSLPAKKKFSGQIFHSFDFISTPFEKYIPEQEKKIQHANFPLLRFHVIRLEQKIFNYYSQFQCLYINHRVKRWTKLK